MNTPIDMLNLVTELPRRRRGKACIVLTHEGGDQRNWAAKLAACTGGNHFDLLEAFATSPALAEKTGVFSVHDLFALLQSQNDKPILIVTGLTFLRAAWSGLSGAMEDFAKQIEFWSRSPALVIVTPQDAFLEKRPFGRFEHTFVVDQRETLAL